MIRGVERGKKVVDWRGWLVVAAAVMLGVESVPLVAQTAQGAVVGPEPIKMMAADADPVFEVATIKPSNPNNDGVDFRNEGRHVSTHNTTLIALISYAYGVHEKQIVGGPEWLSTSKYDTDGVPDVAGEPNMKQTSGDVSRAACRPFQTDLSSRRERASRLRFDRGKERTKAKEESGRSERPA